MTDDDDVPPYTETVSFDIKLLTGPVMAERLSGVGDWHATLHGGLINTAERAVKLGEMIAGIVYNQDTMARQYPFNVRDNGDRWTVYGSHNLEMRDGLGPVKVVLRKWDGAVLEVTMPTIYSDPAERDQEPRPKESLDQWLTPKPLRHRSTPPD